MPELPEVQTIVDELNSHILNKSILEIVEKREGIIINQDNMKLFGKINRIERRGKYIIIHTSQTDIVVHLRMTGKLIYEEDLLKTSSHSRAEIIFKDGTKLIFDDVRAFGKIWILSNYKGLDGIKNLGVEPLNKRFDKDYLKLKIQNRKVPIKSLLLDQNIIAGLGNIYVCEILFRAKIHPESFGKNLQETEIGNIVRQTKIVLSEALRHNGTTISDYRRVDGKTGEFQNFLKVYQKDFCECGNKISKIKIAGRSTYFCDECQKLFK